MKHKKIVKLLGMRQWRQHSTDRSTIQTMPAVYSVGLPMYAVREQLIPK